MSVDKKKDVKKHTCIYCGRSLLVNKFYKTENRLYVNNDNVTAICKECVVELYDHYVKLYDDEKLKDKHPVYAKAIQRVCMILDIYYSESIVEKIFEKNNSNSLISAYIKMVTLLQYRKKNYDDTIDEQKVKGIYLNQNEEQVDIEVNPNTVKTFGEGFEPADYVFLEKEYDDWTSRHECSTKSQEEIFKAICMNRLKAYKANIDGKDTKDLDKTFKELLDTGKLQPKQNKKDDNQYFNKSLGESIGVWENYFKRPIDPPPANLADINHIGELDGFMRGHTCKTVGLKNSFSQVYTDLMNKFKVERPQYGDDEDSDNVFDDIFGEQIAKEGNVDG